MISREDLDRIFGYGAQLDAWAAVVSRQLAKQIPEFGPALEQNAQEELVHNRILAKLWQGPYLSIDYATEIGRSALSPTPIWNAALLNFVERRSEIQFRMAWRLTRNPDILQIANDEARHVKLGREILRTFGDIGASCIGRVAKFLDTVDFVYGVTPHLQALQDLNQKILIETAEALRR